jgi:hypothetical protein
MPPCTVLGVALVLEVTVPLPCIASGTTDPHPVIAMVTRVTVARIEQSLLFIYYDFFALGKRLLGLGVRVPPLFPSANALLREKKTQRFATRSTSW